jgi:glycosyltransferase involved in cell wall biosynthesis
MISVCIPTYNGQNFIEEQIRSILIQLNPEDEIIISDDGSTDETINKLKSLSDKRIKIFYNKRKKNYEKKHYLVTYNCENALRNATGNYIFIADQDDIWKRNKIEKMLSYLNVYDLVMCDCSGIDENNNILFDSFFKLKNIRKGLFNNLKRPTFHGCCIAFNQKILRLALPFPKYTISHDTWLGLIAESMGHTKLIEESLVYYRIHTNNVSGLSNSSNSLYFKIKYRFQILCNLILRLVKIKVLNTFKLSEKNK